MSYILDALRKADAERERGSVPGIHAQPLAGGSAPPVPRRAQWPWPWIGTGALALVLALGWFISRSGPRDAAAPRPAPVAAATAVPQPAPAAPPVAMPRPVPPTEAALPVIRQTRPAPPAPTHIDKPLARADARPGTAASSAASPAPSSAPGDARVYALAELPEEVRRQLPKVSVGGSAYSKKAADRILIVNGQVLHEGDKITPDLVLQQIKLRAAVLAFKGFRYEIAY